jgi:hypothetical protein
MTTFWETVMLLILKRLDPVPDLDPEAKQEMELNLKHEPA